jgi:hypothetical protein
MAPRKSIEGGFFVREPLPQVTSAGLRARRPSFAGRVLHGQGSLAYPGRRVSSSGRPYISFDELARYVVVDRAINNFDGIMAFYYSAKNLESALARCSEHPGATSRFPSQRKTQCIAIQSRLNDARLVANRAQSELVGQIGEAALAGATISCVKRIFPKVTAVIDSVSEEEIADELDGPVRLVADPSLLVVEATSGRTSK